MNRIVLPPPAALDHLIHYFHVEAPAAGVTQLPASPFPILTVTLSGAVQVESAEGKWSAAPTAFVGGPFSRPLRYRALPGTVFIAALLCPGQMPRLVRIPQQRLVDLFWPLADLTGRSVAECLVDRVRACSGAQAWADVLGAWIADHIVMDRGDRSLLSPSTMTGLFADPLQLARAHGVGVRQFERRFLSTYGLSLREIRRLARFVHALSAVMSGHQSNGGFTRLAQEYGYFDQAHMTRDFADLAGSTPGRLVRDARSDSRWSMFQYGRSDLDMMMGRERHERLLRLG